ncbi:MAG: (Fe-S)-binding protein [Candidatus Syntrophonatronum acetioxidans]|uniref:(Fe-S)-binding protein n=1 Tax=Candidatus Syntrophonatronum acetioxidans TaxID=1795816 RepID=A0A424YA54_9FIRM|nr:MAG: (Fe-S)-binding protein [Candidatus Syntrophonatronum acetioxidans]
MLDKISFFKYDSCILCGDCLTECPYLKLTRKEAVEEMNRLVENRPTQKVLQKCVSCYSCNLFCPRDCHPYGLILYRWYQEYLKKGLPARASYFIPTAFPNFRTDLLKYMSAEEKKLVHEWSRTEPGGRMVLYPSCNVLALPHLLQGDYLKDITIAGGWEQCCGEMLFRMGLLDAVEDRARWLTKYYKDKRIDTMLFACPACYHMFSQVLPEQFGARFHFQCRYLASYLLEEVEGSRLPLKKLLSRDITVQDSCHARIMGEEITGSSRRLLEKMGLKIKEGKKREGPGLCCGAAAAANRYNPLEVLKTARGAFQKAQETGPEEIALYCGGCLLTLDISGKILLPSLSLRHLLEYFQEALGGGGNYPTPQRTRRLLINIALKSLPQLISTKRIRLGPQEEKQT